MPAYHFPILICEAHDGHSLACLLDDAGATSAVAQSPGAAIDQIKDVLQWRAKTQMGLPEPVLRNAVLTIQKVELRAEYKDEKNQRHLCQEPVTLRFPCVRGTDEAGLLLCVLPTLGIRFSYYDAEGFKGLVAYYVQSELKDQTPQQLARLLPPKSFTLEDLVIHVPRVDRKAQRQAPRLTALPPIADPLGGREFRRRLSRPWERDREVADLVNTLRADNSSVLLVGDSGVGKSAILVEAVRKLERAGASYSEDSATPAPQGHSPRFWLTSASRLIAGMKYLGQWQERVEALIAELAEIGGVLCVESLLDLVQIGGTGPVDSIASFLMPYLQRRELRLVAEATPAELDACRRVLPGFAEALQVMNIPRMSRTAAISALNRLAAQLGQNHRVEPEPSAIDSVYRLFARFMPYQGLPGPGATFLAQSIESASYNNSSRVTRDLIISRFIRRTGLPELFLRDDLLLDEAKVIAQLRQRIVGQDTACAAAASVITSYKAGMNDPERPISVMLFSGPTGVGKPGLARAIADFLFGHGEHRDRMIRLDMSEYSSTGSADRILTDSSGRPSELIKRTRQQPFNLVLLDEIEKAAPQVFDVLLTLLDGGCLTDRLGRHTFFRSTVVAMTSNLGANRTEPFGLSRMPTRRYDGEVAAFFRPELVNRIDLIVSFQPLDHLSIRTICAKELNELLQREGLAKRNLTLNWTDEVIEHLAKHGFDRRYGAPPLQRIIDTHIAVPLSHLLISHSDLRNATITATIDDAGGKLRFHIPSTKK